MTCGRVLLFLPVHQCPAERASTLRHLQNSDSDSMRTLTSATGMQADTFLCGAPGVLAVLAAAIARLQSAQSQTVQQAMQACFAVPDAVPETLDERASLSSWYVKYVGITIVCYRFMNSWTSTELSFYKGVACSACCPHFLVHDLRYAFLLTLAVESP